MRLGWGLWLLLDSRRRPRGKMSHLPGVPITQVTQQSGFKSQFLIGTEKAVFSFPFGPVEDDAHLLQPLGLGVGGMLQDFFFFNITVHMKTKIGLTWKFLSFFHVESYNPWQRPPYNTQSIFSKLSPLLPRNFKTGW